MMEESNPLDARHFLSIVMVIISVMIWHGKTRTHDVMLHVITIQGVPQSGTFSPSNASLSISH